MSASKSNKVEPKFILSKKKVIEQYNIVEKIADFVSYSSKTNQDVTKVIEDLTDCWLSVHFENELEHVRDLSRALFLSQGWNNATISRLLKKGVNKFVVDNEVDLDILLEFLKSFDGKITLFLRLKLKENTVRTERHFVFGMRSNVINKRIAEISSDPLLESKIFALGIHFHRKTQNMSEWGLIRELEDIIEPETLRIIDYLNIGGGLPSVYKNTNRKVITGIFKKIEELRDWLHTFGTKMIIEPGRFIAAAPVSLETNIIRIFENTIIVDASVYNCDMDAIIVPAKLLIKDELPQGEGQPYIIKGVTPCSLDIFRYRVYLNNPKEGDKITFLNAGAYNFASDFCDLRKIKTEIVE